MIFSRIASIVIILLSIGSLYCVQQLRQGRDELRVENTKLLADIATAKAQIASAEAKLRDGLAVLPTVSNTLAKAVSDLESTKKTLTNTTQEREKLKSDLAEAQRKVPPLSAQLAAAKEALNKAEATIAKQSAEIATIDGFKKRIAALTAENRTFGSKIEVLLAEIKRLELENEDLRITPVNCRGHVAGVENRWNFIILDIGQDQKVRKNAQFLVYREKKFICKAQVITVNENTAVAEVLPEERHGDPRVGDLAIH
jgi:chromosome segregation ATPase